MQRKEGGKKLGDSEGKARLDLPCPSVHCFSCRFFQVMVARDASLLTQGTWGGAVYALSFSGNVFVALSVSSGLSYQYLSYPRGVGVPLRGADLRSSSQSC